MVTHQYSRILDEDRQRISRTMDDKFYSKQIKNINPDPETIFAMLQEKPELAEQLLAMFSVAKVANAK